LPGTAQRCHDGTVGLDGVPRELLVAIAAVFATFALVAAIWSWLRGVRRRRRFARAAAGEREARGLLEAHGFVIEGAQVAGSYELAVDGAPLTAAVRADYVVRAGGLRYVAEVKTGRVAPSLATATMRRQLLGGGRVECGLLVEGLLRGGCREAVEVLLRRFHLPLVGVDLGLNVLRIAERSDALA
jgi:hypothetical protein